MKLHVRSSLVSAALVPVAVLASAEPLRGQDQFGSAVGVTAAGEVVALKPAFGRGPAALVVFAPAPGSGWTATQQLWSEGTATRGENFGPAVAVFGADILVASGDPDVRIGAYGFSRGADGSWSESGAIALATGGRAGPGAVTLQTVMRILQPPLRRVAADGSLAVVAVSQPGGGTAVRAFMRGGSGRSAAWSDAGTLAADGAVPNSGFGAAVAVRGDLVAVGAPRQGASGAVMVFVRDGGSWRVAATLADEALTGGAGLGSALAFGPDGTLFAGAPAASSSRGAVVAFSPSGGAWSATRIDPEGSSAGLAFGSAVAATETELWIGAPGAEDSRGRVDRFTREGAGWRAAGSMTDPSLDSRSRMGAAVAIGGGVAAVGAPGAVGNAGLTAIFVADGAGWSGPAWVRGGEDLEVVSGGQIRCEDGAAAGFDCNAVELDAFLPLAAIGAQPGERVSDAWGWTDPQTGREYGLVGRTAGAAIIDVTEPSSPVYLGYIPANPSGARDLKVYDDHLFFTGDGAGAHGLVVFDLTRLRDVSGGPQEFEPDARFTGIGSAHNLVIDTESGFAYTVSTSGEGQTCGGGLVMIDIREPLAPSFVGCFTDTEGLLFPGRTHDAQCVIYDGPDEEYRGRQLCFASNETALRIVDVSDKENPNPISAAAYPGVAYIHQGWLTDDHRYFYLDDELDELIGTTERTRTLIWDVSDLDDPVVVGEHFGPNGSTDHNLYIKGDRMYQANYQAGLRVVDISDPEAPREVGFFDTTPYGADPPGFNGAWTVFPFFESGSVLVTSMQEGVFLLRPRRQELVP